MKGRPGLRIALVLLLLAFVFWPILKITRNAGPSGTTPPTPIAVSTTQPPIDAALNAILLLHTAPTPLKCSVTQNGLTLLCETNLIAPGEYWNNIRLTKGEDLLITAKWGDSDPHALKAELMVQGYQVHLEKIFWSQESLEDTLPIPDSFLP